MVALGRREGLDLFAQGKPRGTARKICTGTLSYSAMLCFAPILLFFRCFPCFRKFLCLVLASCPWGSPMAPVPACQLQIISFSQLAAPLGGDRWPRDACPAGRLHNFSSDRGHCGGGRSMTGSRLRDRRGRSVSQPPASHCVHNTHR